MTSLKPLNLNNEIKKKIKGSLPGYLISTRPNGKGQSLSYYDGYTIIDVLNYIFGYMWSFEIDKSWIEPSQDLKRDNKDGTTEYIPQGPVAHIIGRLVVPMETESGQVIYITKASNGSKEIIGNQASQADSFKSAQTDAIKKAASLLGIAGELYRKEKSIYFFEKIFYESLWTDELKEEYKVEFEYLYQYLTETQLTETQLDDIMLNATNGVYGNYIQLSPDNIILVVDYIKSKTEA